MLGDWHLAHGLAVSQGVTLEALDPAELVDWTYYQVVGTMKAEDRVKYDEKLNLPLANESVADVRADDPVWSAEAELAAWDQFGKQASAAGLR